MTFSCDLREGQRGQDRLMLRLRDALDLLHQILDEVSACDGFQVHCIQFVKFVLIDSIHFLVLLLSLFIL